MSIAGTNHVIATGGRVVYSPKAMNHLSNNRPVIYLAVDLKPFFTRFPDVTARSAAISPGKSIEDLYKERTPLYDRYCDIRIHCHSMTAEQVAEKAIGYLF